MAGLICLAGLFGLAGLLWLGNAVNGELHTEDWTIEDGETVTISDEIEELEGNLTVNGTLTLDNVTLKYMEPKLRLMVGDGGLLEMVGGSVEAPGLANYTATIGGEVNAEDTMISGFNNAWAVDEGGSLEFNGVTLDATDEVWGLKAKYADHLRLDGVTFKGMSEAAVVTYGNPGWITGPVYDMEAGAVRQEHYFAANMELKEGTGVDLAGNALQILNGSDSITVVEFWSEGELDLEVPSWTRVDGATNVTHGPYSYRISWPLNEGGGSLITWGRVLWEADLTWTADGPAGPTVVTLENPALDFTLTQVAVATDKPSKWEDLTISAVINNPNPVQVIELNIGLYDDTQPMSWVKVEEIEPQGSKAFNVTWSNIHVSGDLELTLKIDPDSKMGQWTNRGDRDKTVEVSVSTSSDGEDDDPAWWIAALVLLFLAGLIIYAVMTNLKLVEGLKEEDDGDLEARERRLAEREREFQRKVDRTQDSEPEEETRDSGSEETAEETGPQEDKAPEPEPPAEDPSPFNEEAATQALGGIAPPHPINGADEPGAPDEPDPEPQE